MTISTFAGVRTAAAACAAALSFSISAPAYADDSKYCPKTTEATPYGVEFSNQKTGTFRSLKATPYGFINELWEVDTSDGGFTRTLRQGARYYSVKGIFPYHHVLFDQWATFELSYKFDLKIGWQEFPDITSDLNFKYDGTFSGTGSTGTFTVQTSATDEKKVTFGSCGAYDALIIEQDITIVVNNETQTSKTVWAHLKDLDVSVPLTIKPFDDDPTIAYNFDQIVAL